MKVSTRLLTAIRKTTALFASSAVVVAAAMALSSTADARGHGTGPQFSLDIEAFCGDPVAVELDEDGNVIQMFDENVAVRLTDVSDDNGPVDPQVELLTIECLAAVKMGRGKPAQVNFATILIPAPGFGVIDATCPLGSLPADADEWKARATASGGDLRRTVSDTCEEVPVP